MFHNRTIAIATMHAKESVIAPLFEKTFNSNCIVPESLNTDLLGTFSGEIQREEDPLNVARKKCFLAMDLTGSDIAIASEGSFGGHPDFVFSNADDEIVVLVDRKNNFEAVGRELSTNTNLSGMEINTFQEALAFAKTAEFPSHGLILRDAKGTETHIHKGITKKAELETIVRELILKFGSAYIETDMRAMYNPTRMKVIKKATQNLISKLLSSCPSCNYPGYWISKGIKGLPCALCAKPTKSILAHEYNCVNCNHNEQRTYPYSKKMEDPMYCDFCNP